MTVPTAFFRSPFVYQTAPAPNTGSVYMNAPVAPMRSFVSQFNSGSYVSYCIKSIDGTLFEQGYGTVTTTGGTDVLARSAGNVTSGTNGAGVLVNFTGVVTVTNANPAIQDTIDLNPTTVTATTTLSPICSPLTIATMDSSSQTLTLPDARTLPLGVIRYIYRTSGGNGFSILDSSGGTVVASASASSMYALVLTANTTAAGTWAQLGATTASGYGIFTGSTTWVVPAGVTTVRVLTISGAPGSGSGWYPVGPSYGSSSGNFAVGTYSVTPGTPITISVGVGGAAGTGPAVAGLTGGTTSFGALQSSSSGTGSSFTSAGTGAAAGGSPASNGASPNVSALSILIRASIAAGAIGTAQGSNSGYYGGGGAAGLLLPGVANPSGGNGGNIDGYLGGSGGTGFGAGAGGGANHLNAVGASGGNGAQGAVYVEW